MYIWKRIINKILVVLWPTFNARCFLPVIYSWLFVDSYDCSYIHHLIRSLTLHSMSIVRNKASLHVSLNHAHLLPVMNIKCASSLRDKKSTIVRKTRRSFFTFTPLCKIDREAVERSKCRFPDTMVSLLVPGESHSQANMLPIHVNPRIMLEQFIFKSLVNHYLYLDLC